MFKSKLGGNTPPNICFKKEHTKVILNNKQNCEYLAKYFETLLNCDSQTQELILYKPQHKMPHTGPHEKEDLVQNKYLF